MTTTPQPQIAVGLDAGSSRTRCVIGAIENGGIRYLAHGLAPAAGWAKGRIIDPVALAESIRAAVIDAERGAHVSVESVTLGVGGMDVRGAQSRGLYEFGRPHELRSEDLEYAVALAADVRLERDRALLHVLPSDFTLDGRAGFRRPQQSVCSRLEANVHIVTCSEQEHHAILHAVQQASYAVEESMFEPVATAYASVNRDDRNRGVAVVDIGKHSTDIVVYDGEAVLLARSLAISADHFTRDVAVGLTVQYNDAERLKIEYGCAMVGLTSDNSFIEVPSNEGRLPREAPRKQLNEILEARAEELFIHVGSELVTIGMDQKLLEGVILAGGGAMLNGMCDMAERVLNCPARNAIPQGIQDFPDDLSVPAWSSASGLARYSARLKTNRETKRRAPGLMGMLFR
jgi:cell division protein FtsA